MRAALHAPCARLARAALARAPPSARSLAAAPQSPHQPPLCFRGGRRRESSLSAGRLAAYSRATAGAAAPLQRSFEDILLECNNINGLAHALWARVVRAGDTCVDATAGNGFDTVALARLGAGRVLALDVQQAALDVTAARLRGELSPEQAAACELRCCCHSTLGELVSPGSVALVAFNLGFLPLPGTGGAPPPVGSPPPPPRLATQPDTTVAALAAATRALRVGGAVSVMVYTGHEGGLEEAAAVDAFAAALPTAEWTATSIALVNRAAAPRLLLLYKRERPTKGR